MIPDDPTREEIRDMIECAVSVARVSCAVQQPLEQPCLVVGWGVTRERSGAARNALQAATLRGQGLRGLASLPGSLPGGGGSAQHSGELRVKGALQNAGRRRVGGVAGRCWRCWRGGPEAQQQLRFNRGILAARLQGSPGAPHSVDVCGSAFPQQQKQQRTALNFCILQHA